MKCRNASEDEAHHVLHKHATTLKKHMGEIAIMVIDMEEFVGCGSTEVVARSTAEMLQDAHEGVRLPLFVRRNSACRH